MAKSTGNQGKPPDPTGGLPCNLDAERFVLGSILLVAERHLPAVRTELQPSDFILEKHRRIYRRALELHERGEKVDRVTVAEELARHRELSSCDGLTYLNSLDDGLPQIPNIASYARIVKEKAVLRSVIFGADALAKRAMLAAEDPDTVIAAGTDFFAGLKRGRNHQEEPEEAGRIWPEPMRPEAFHGIVGELVRVIEPHTESDPAALLVQSLVTWGSLIGRGPYYLAEADRHHTNLYTVIVGLTAKGRKGTSLGRVRGILATVDEHWNENCLLSGLGSGEGLIDAVGADGADKRCLIIEPELARLLAVLGRDGCTLSANLRDGWDSGQMAIRTRQTRIKVAGVHLSLIGHVTRDELLRRLDNTELANGLCNRMLWVCARRSKELPHGGGWPELGSIARQFEDATEFARKAGQTRVQMKREAKALWESEYHALSEGRPGLLGAVTSRSEAQVVRLALIFALLDRCGEISEEHLKAALAVWAYCSASCQYVWGDLVGDPLADQIQAALRRSREGLSRTEIRDILGRNYTTERIGLALLTLAEYGHARMTRETTGGRGRPEERWFAA